MPIFLVVRSRSGPEWDTSTGIREQRGWSDHAAFMDELASSGFIRFGGPIDADDRVVFAVEAESVAAIRTTLAADPWSDSHLVLAEVAPWSIWLDSRNAD